MKFETPNTENSDMEGKFNQDMLYRPRIAIWEAELSLRPKKIDEETEKDILDKTQIHGEPFGGQLLKTKDLIENNLTPKYLINLSPDRKNFTALSNPYLLDGGRLGAMGYVSVDKGESVVVRSYYRSNSQGLWRYLPSYTLSADDKNHISWYSKGVGEESLTLPITLQKALARASQADKSIITLDNPSFFFAGTSRSGFNSGDSYVRHVDEEGSKLRGNFYTTNEGEKINPSSLEFSNSLHKPKFSRMLSSWDQNTSLYGSVAVEAFPSQDGTLVYMFCRDERNRVWVGAVDNINKIGTTGLRNVWITAGDLTTPAYEYWGQDCGYGNNKDTSGSYVDMFENYLRHTPIIQEYIRERNIPTVIEKTTDPSVVREAIATGKYSLVEKRIREIAKHQPLTADAHEEIDSYSMLLEQRKAVLDKQPKIKGGETIIIRGGALEELENLEKTLQELDKIRVSSF